MTAHDATCLRLPLPAWQAGGRQVGWTVVLILTLMVLVGCTREVVRYQSVPLPFPTLSDLPIVYDVELACVSEDAAIRLEARQNQMREDLEACFKVICTTHPECGSEELTKDWGR